MATVSSHILDSTSGDSARGIRVQLFRIDSDGMRSLLFDESADQEGRIAESVFIGNNIAVEGELVFHAADYFVEADKGAIEDVDNVLMKTVVVRFTMRDDNRRYHIPLMLAPHSYSVWWSK